MRSPMLAQIGLCLALIGCGSREPSWAPPDIVVISVDTLRADHLPTYGYPQPTAPRIDELARQSRVFDRAYTPAPFTLPAHASLLTGLHPDRHSLHQRGDTLAPGIVTLAELLAASGYATGGFTNGYFVSPAFGLDRGFGVFDFKHEFDDPRNAEQTNAAILEWLDGLDAGPFFLFAHYFDVHSDWQRLPYDSPEEQRKQFAGPEPDGFRVGNGSKVASRFMALLNRDGLSYRDDELRYVEGLYDAGLAYTDAQVGRLLDALRERGRFEKAIVILTSDHGEEFQDHGKLLHTQIFEELVRIPLLVSLPEMRGDSSRSCRPAAAGPPVDLASIRAGRSELRVQLEDVLPTLAECLGVPAPVANQGRSFLPTLLGASAEPRTIFIDHRRHDEWAVIDDDWKLLLGTGDAPPQLYHLPSDPGELRNVAASEPAVVAQLAAALTGHREQNARIRFEGGRREVAEEVQQALEQLGYVREARQTPGDPAVTPSP
jgi:arylsulfatase A-like enzyme